MELVQAASETTWTVMLRFVSAWAIWPDRMKAAQDEIDRVVGADRLPTFEDRPNLPLVEAVCRGQSCPPTRNVASDRGFVSQRPCAGVLPFLSDLLTSRPKISKLKLKARPTSFLKAPLFGATFVCELFSELG